MLFSEVNRFLMETPPLIAMIGMVSSVVDG